MVILGSPNTDSRQGQRSVGFDARLRYILIAVRVTGLQITGDAQKQLAVGLAGLKAAPPVEDRQNNGSDAGVDITVY